MSTNHLPRRIALGTATFLASGAMVLSGVTAAHADDFPVGTLSFTPATGFDNSTMNIVSSGPCTTGTNLIASVTGQGFPDSGYNVLGNSPTTTFSQNDTGGYIVPLFDTMQTFAKNNSITALSGKYTFTLACRNAFGAATFDSFTGSIWFTTPTTYVSQDPSGPTVTATSTTLSVAPGGSAGAGSAVTLTAAVSPDAPGTVQFLDGTTPLGTVPVAAGAASLSVSNLAVGAHQLRAVFTSSSTTFSGSNSAATPYTISPAGSVATSTSLIATPSGSAAAGSSVTLTSTTTPAAAAGSVTFTDANTGTVLGTQTVSGGSASLTVSTLAEGSHNLTASFTPADATAYQASVSVAVPFTVTPAGGGNPGTPNSGTENINTTVAAGALALSVAGSNVNLPPLTLNSTSTLFAAAGPIQTVTVTDTRAGAPGWALSGQVADFTSSAGTISAQNLGWAPNLVNKGDGVKVALGGTVAPANGVASSDGGALGLKSSRTLATATGLGTAQIGADLSLVAPTSTVAGAYTGVLTLTVM
ncbi:Ig-like domain repeat protein [Streptacidiphilus sp. N1-12]|uniref:Ig-like domain repeat protein n=2 Tax=Streptacidiphilus alkalitolerans TaxID=3342712 RepID=A0ABV6WFV5_9ACTN